MKFSNTTYGFYPSDNEKLAAYQSLPDDLQDVTEEDLNKFTSGEIGPLVHLVDGILETRLEEKTDEEKLSLFLKSVSVALSICNSVGLQCYMTSSPYPIDWVSYREKLVALTSATEWNDLLVLPTQPDIPTDIVI